MCVQRDQDGTYLAVESTKINANDRHGEGESKGGCVVEGGVVMERKDERNAYAACSICGTPIRFYAPKIWYPDLASLPFLACSRSFVHLPPRTSRASSISGWV